MKFCSSPRSSCALFGRLTSSRPHHRGVGRRATCLQVECLEARDLPSVAGISAEALPAIAGLQVTAPDHLAGPSVGGSRISGSATPVGYSPAQVRHAYGIDAVSFAGIVGDGRGQTIAIVDAYYDPTIAADLATFDARFGLAAPPSFRVINQNGGSTLPTNTDPRGPSTRSWEGETALDVEWAHAVAPRANILLVQANDDQFSSLFTAVGKAASQPGVSAVSMSFGGHMAPDGRFVAGEMAADIGYDGSFVTPPGHAGVTFVAASGDNGVAEYPATSPNVLAVGGTRLTVGAGNSYGGESGWSGSGGGISTIERRPAYQAAVLPQGTMRGSPDVAYDADPASGVAVCDSFDYGAAHPWMPFAEGGTSAAAPQWAALIAIANQGRALAGRGSLDGPNQTLPILYAVSASDFHDITSGRNAGQTAGPGYDLVTGRGTPVASRLVADLVNPPTIGQFNLAGGWFANRSQPTSITQNGDALSFTNERGQTSRGTFLSGNVVVASDWGNLQGTIQTFDDGVFIRWTNGTTWVEPTVGGIWYIHALQATQIIQNGPNLVFVNEWGARSAGYFLSADRVMATGWGNLQGAIYGDRILWANGTAWTRSGLAGFWFINGTQLTQIVQSGGSLQFTNEHGSQAAGFIAGNNVVAPGWGGLVGTVVESAYGETIFWANGTRWTRPDLQGMWFINNQATEVLQALLTLTFINERGEVSAGQVMTTGWVRATDWGYLFGSLIGLPTGSIVIDWTNGTAWLR